MLKTPNERIEKQEACTPMKFETQRFLFPVECRNGTEVESIIKE